MDINIALLNDKKYNFENISNYTTILNNTNKIYDIKIINGNKIKIGIIGYVINKKGMCDLEKIKNEIILNVTELKEKNVDSIILLTNLEVRCIDKNVNIKMYKNFTQRCDEYSINNKSIFNVLKNISNIDAVIISNSYDNQINHWVNDIPIMSSPSKGKYFNIMYLPFKKQSNKYILFKNEIKIEGPIPICQKIFNDTKICSDDFLTRTGELIDFFWHDRKIFIDKELKETENKLNNVTCV